MTRGSDKWIDLHIIDRGYKLASVPVNKWQKDTE